MLLEPRAQRLRLLTFGLREIGFDAGRRRRRRRAEQLVEHPGTAQHRRGSVAVRRTQQHRALTEQPVAPGVGQLDAAKLRADDSLDTVVARKTLVQKSVVGRQQRPDVLVLEQDAGDE